MNIGSFGIGKILNNRNLPGLLGYIKKIVVTQSGSEVGTGILVYNYVQLGKIKREIFREVLKHPEMARTCA